MAWSWLLNLAPAADSLFAGINNILRRSSKKKELIENVAKQFNTLYSSSIRELERDVAIIASWKPIVARAHMIEMTIRSWDTVITIAREQKQPAIALGVISEKRVKVVSGEIDKISDVLRKASGKADINWREGGADLESAVDRMKNHVRDLAEKVKLLTSNKDSDPLMLMVELELNDLRDELVVIFNYWDAFLQDLAVNAAAAPKRFQAGLPKQVESTIKLEFDNTKWADILKNFHDALNAD